MPTFNTLPPLSLYIHLPWCVRKCPYCDFNSHQASAILPEEDYVTALTHNLETLLLWVQKRPLTSIFFGGGTPSLFSAQSIEKILTRVFERFAWSPNIEITLEANPGTVEAGRFADFRLAGINRLSLGVQSLQDEKLKALGRIHDHTAAIQAIRIIQQAGFTNWNLDLMYGLPQQSLADALFDIHAALSFQPPHLSWYQLTLEPNTEFYRQPPPLPEEDHVAEISQTGEALLEANGLHRYEVSAYAKAGHLCQHNLNYWEFGDYLGIGAGAHSKVTDIEKGQVVRFAQTRHPLHFLTKYSKAAHQEYQTISPPDLIFEFMLNSLRLTAGIPLSLFTARTGLDVTHIEPMLTEAKKRGLLEADPDYLRPSAKGRLFLNDLIGLFLA